MLRRSLAVPVLLLAFAGRAGAAPCVQTGSGTPLRNAATNLSAGQFCELTTLNFNGGAILATPANGGNILEYTDSAVWDPARRQFSFLGVSHHGSFIAKFVRYLEDTNTWQEGPLPASSDSLVHGYDHNAINPATGDVFFRPFNSRTFYRYSIGTGQWGQIASVPTSVLPNIQVAGGLEYFPERNGLVFVDSAGVALWTAATNTWSLIQASPGIGGHSNFIEFNPVHRVMWFGGGSSAAREIRKLAASGSVTPLADAPIDMAMDQTIVTVDPVSGKYLVFSGTTANQFWQYDIVADSWSVVARAHPLWTSGGVINTVETPIENHGVILFVKFNPPAVYLYKHSPGGGGTQPPGTPTGLRVQ